VTVAGEPRPPPGVRHPARPGRFPRRRLEQATLDAAHALIGAHLIRDAVPASDDTPALARRVGRIVEVEAYIGEEDRASHARFGPTDRNRVMYGPAGIAYVYLVYGMHHCLNVVTEPAGRPAALLVRAVEPLDGIDAMRAAREELAAAFGITRQDTGMDLCDPASSLRLAAAPAGEPLPGIVAGPRIGIAYAAEPWTSVPWRFVVAGSHSLSGRAR